MLTISILEELRQKFIIQITCDQEGYTCEAWYDEVPSYYHEKIAESHNQSIGVAIIELNEMIKNNINKLIK